MTESPEDLLPGLEARQRPCPAARHGPHTSGWFPALLLLGGLAAAYRIDAGAAAPPSGACAADPGTLVPMRVRRVADVPFEWIVEDLELAITERNFRITGRNSLGKGLRERGHTGYPDFEIIHFCNLENARTVLDLDPGFVAQMPCRVTVHSEDTAVVVSMLLLPETHRDARVANFARAINVELCAIQDDAVIRR
jgi:uncharacterized protein (DUF302 family)